MLAGLGGCANTGEADAAFDAAASAEMARRPELYVNGEARGFLVSCGGARRGLLWGTWHVGYDAATVLPREARRRFSAARRLLVEQVWDEAPAATRQRLAEVIRGGQLGGDPAAVARLGAAERAALAEAGIRGEELGRYNLMGLAGLVSQRALTAEEPGLLPTAGFVDLTLIGFARSVGIPVAGLEEPDPDVVRRLFYAEPNGGDAADALRLALRRRGTAAASVGWLRGQYAAGQVGAMAAALTAWQAGPADLRRADVARAGLLTDRNLAWLPRLERELAARDGEAGVFAAFGAAHLMGRDGVVALLRDRGWVVDACVGDQAPGVGG